MRRFFSALSSLFFPLLVLAMGCVADGGDVGDYCREDRDCNRTLVCAANECRTAPGDAGSR